MNLCNVICNVYTWYGNKLSLDTKVHFLGLQEEFTKKKKVGKIHSIVMLTPNA